MTKVWLASLVQLIICVHWKDGGAPPVGRRSRLKINLKTKSLHRLIIECNKFDPPNFASSVTTILIWIWKMWLAGLVLVAWRSSLHRCSTNMTVAMGYMGTWGPTSILNKSFSGFLGIFGPQTVGTRTVGPRGPTVPSKEVYSWDQAQNVWGPIT